MKIVHFFLVILCTYFLFVGNVSATNGGKNNKAVRLSKRTLNTIYTRWFSTLYIESHGKKPQMVINGKLIGTFLEGIRGAVYYAGLNGLFAKAAGRKSKDFYDISAIEYFAGMKIFTIPAKGNKQGHINPAFIPWATKNLVPSPQSKVDGYLFQTVYTKVLQRFFRLSAASYLYLKKANKTGAEVRTYQSFLAMNANGGLKYLKMRFKDALPQFGIAAQRKRPYTIGWTPDIAIGFWMRRTLDGTAPALWKALTTVLKSYDAIWLRNQLAPPSQTAP